MGQHNWYSSVHKHQGADTLMICLIYKLGQLIPNLEILLSVSGDVGFTVYIM